MEQGNDDVTRAMDAADGAERTILQEPAAGATQMGQTITCAVCGTANTGLDLYCRDCGFLLASEPGEPLEDEAKAGPVVRLVDRRSGRIYALRPGVNTVGRESADVLLIDASVSRRHAEITVEHETAIVNDLGSTNGTQINDVVLEPNRARPARDGAEVSFGNTTLVLEVESAPIDAEAEAGEIPGLAVGDLSVHATLDPLPEAGPVEAAPAGAEPNVIARLRSLVHGRDDIELRAGETTVGRKSDNSTPIVGDPYISGHHARFDAEAGSIYLTDLGSTNGTMLNSQKVVPSVRVQLAAGDQIALGQGRYAVEMVEPAEEDEPESEDQAK